MKRYALLLVILGQLALGKDYFWKPNSNWNNPANWELGRVPCGRDVASFASVPDNSIIYLDEDVILQTIILPENGQIILGSNVALTLSEDSICGDGMPGTDQGTESAQVDNAFIGATARYWECSENWITEDMFPAEHPPCGDDRAIFDEGAYFFSVKANESISVSSLQVRGMQITSKANLDANEFQLDIAITPECANNPSLCPCPSDVGCMSRVTTTSSPGVTVPLASSNRNTVIGVVVGLLLAVIITVVICIIVIVIILMYRRQRQFGRYKKDDFLEETDAGELTYEEQSHPKTSTTDSRSFDNPVYESTTLTAADVQLTSYQEKPKLDFKTSDPELASDMDNYEVVDNVATPSSGNDDNLVKVDLGALADHEPVLDTYEPHSDGNSQPAENGKEEKKKKPSSTGKYERL